MKLKLLSFSLLFSILTYGCSLSKGMRKEKIPYDDQYSQICEIGRLETLEDGITPAKYGVNVLPPGFYGSYPDTGIFEIGNRAGDENGKLCPVLDFNVKKRNTTILFSIQFEENPLYFKMNSIRKQLGYEICYLDENGTEKEIKHFTKADSLGEVYSVSQFGDYHFDDSYSKVTSFIYSKKNALCLTFNFLKKEKLKYIRFIYGDIPMTYINVSATLSRKNIDEDIEAKYHSNNDCNRYDYTQKLGSDVEYEMTSQYGYCYSKNYLLSLFIVKDETDNTQDHLISIEDENNYFETGRYAPLGSKYNLKFKKTNSLGVTSTLTLRLTVRDKASPLIEKKSEEEITVSYRDVYQREFIDKYFNVTDNYDSFVQVKITDSSGEEIKKEIGKTSVILHAVDSSNNETKYPFVLNRYDDVPPTIETKQDEIILNKDEVMTSASLLSLFSITDEIDGKIPPKVEENTYSENCHDVGEYCFTVSGEDKSGNRSVKSIRVLVQENDKPIFYAKESFFTFVEGNIPSEEQILSSLVRNEVIPDKNYERFDYVSGDEITNNLKEGSYESTYDCVAEDNSSTLVDIKISVIKKENSEVEKTTQEEEKEEETFWQRFCRWWKELFQAILDAICFWK